MPPLAARTFKQQRPQRKSRLSPLHLLAWARGIHWFWAKWEKEENHTSHRSGLAWTQPGKLSGRALWAQHGLTVVPLQCLDLEQEYKSSSLYIQGITEGTNWDILGWKNSKRGPEPTPAPVGICFVCTRAGPDNDHHQTPEQELFWQEATAKIFYNLRFSSVETPLVWMPTSVIMSLCENLTFFFWLSKAVRTSPICKLQLCPDYRNNCHQPFTAARALCQHLLFHLKPLPDSSWADHAAFRDQNLSWERKGWETGKEFPKEPHKDDP